MDRGMAGIPEVRDVTEIDGEILLLSLLLIKNLGREAGEGWGVRLLSSTVHLGELES